MTHVQESRGEKTSGRRPVTDRVGRVIVGVDGSEAAAHALRWASHKESVFGEITPVTVYQLPMTFDLLTRPPTGSDLALYREAAKHRLTATVTAEAPLLLERAQVIESHPGAGLVEAAADADLLVVGTQGHSAMATALLGSVSAYCVNNSTVPVALIPPAWPATRSLSTVVVGVDGSVNAEHALRWVVHNVAPHLGPDGRIIAAGALSIWVATEAGYEQPMADLEENLTRSVSKATGSSYHGPEIETRIEARDPRALLSETTEAEVGLLVIGARGTSGLNHLILGSVSSALVHHPKVATVMVPSGYNTATTTE